MPSHRLSRKVARMENGSFAKRSRGESLITKANYALSTLDSNWITLPRALPWAFTFRAFGGDQNA